LSVVTSGARVRATLRVLGGDQVMILHYIALIDEARTAIGATCGSREILGHALMGGLATAALAALTCAMLVHANNTTAVRALKPMLLSCR